MANLIKFVVPNARTRRGLQWGENITHSLPACDNPDLWGGGDVFHVHEDKELALLVYPVYGVGDNFRLWSAQGDVVVRDALIAGVFTLTTLEKLDLPKWYVDTVIRHRIQVQFTVLCATAVLPLFEAEYPNDRRPREAIESAQAWLNSPTENNVCAAVDAANVDESEYVTYYAAFAAARGVVAALAPRDAAKAAVSIARANGTLNIAALAAQAVAMQAKNA